MKRQILIAVASVVLGASILVGCGKSDTTASNTGADTSTPGQKTSNAVASAGQKTANGLGEAVDKAAAATQPSTESAIKATQKTLAVAVEDALTNNDFNKLVSQFTKADRDRIGKQSDDSLADLNAAIGQFRRDWQAKYNQDFKLSDKEQVVFATPVIIQSGSETEASLASSSTPGPDAAAAKEAAKRANNTTTVTIPKGDAGPGVSLTLHNEEAVMNDYKIDVPDNLDAATLKANLIKHINHIESMKDQWPSDVNEASRIVSQHILKAISESGGGGSASIK